MRHDEQLCPSTEEEDFPDQDERDNRMMVSSYIGVLMQTALGIYASPEKTTWTATHEIDFLGKYSSAILI